MIKIPFSYCPDKQTRSKRTMILPLGKQCFLRVDRTNNNKTKALLGTSTPKFELPRGKKPYFSEEVLGVGVVSHAQDKKSEMFHQEYIGHLKILKKN